MSDDAHLALRILELEHKMDYLMEQLQLTDKYHSVLPGADSDVMSLALSGQTIQAIKLYRERHNTDLGEAKRAIDALLARPR